ncbi:MAG: hypothetical protein ACLFVJ_10290 [Persicimonas sp.]
MKWSVQAHAGRGGRLLVLLVAVATLAVACSTPTQNSDGGEGEGDEVIGKPPSAEEDPFFVTGESGSAEPVAPSGRIDEDDKDDKDDEAEATNEADEDQADELASREPDDSTDRPDRSETAQPDQQQCFSCVRICPAEGDCDRAKDDVICGWGVHDDQAQASRLAEAECDAALDMARQMPVWSDIAGQCPAATCR